MARVSIEKAKTAFKQWREERGGGRGHAPDELRRLALAIYRQYGETRTCRELSVSSSALWRWKQKPLPPKQSKVRPKQRSMASKTHATPGVKRECPPGFIDLTAAAAVRLGGSPLQPSGSTGGMHIEWLREDGGRMKVSGALLDLAQIEQLAERFLAQAGRRASS